MPHLVHGGPGRAGGGEELGGIRAVLHHMQRTAIQGSPDLLTAITGVWHEGAAARQRGAASVPQVARDRCGSATRCRRASRRITLDDIEEFATSTGDTFYAHMDEDAATANPFFPGRVAHGYLLVSWAAGLFVDPAPGPVLANYGLENLRFLTPVVPGDSIRVALTAKQITPRETDDYGEVRWDARILEPARRGGGHLRRAHPRREGLTRSVESREKHPFSACRGAFRHDSTDGVWTGSGVSAG